jgi:predicted SAM-dependent methyltransferase
VKYLNLGCGSNYSKQKEKEWVNLDFFPNGENIIKHNLLLGIPFENNSFDLVYHSHVLERFSKGDGEKFIAACFRVLKPRGILRVVVPDLERIARIYLKFLEQGIENSTDKIVELNYSWMLLEMFDQMVRNSTGGNMAKYLFQENILNEGFIFERIGEEGRNLRSQFISDSFKIKKIQKQESKLSFGANLLKTLKKHLFKKLKIDEKALAIGKFRMQGEIHQWMYDRYSLQNLLKKCGGSNIQIRDAFSSFDKDWLTYELDSNSNGVRKPDSLFMEAIK